MPRRRRPPRSGALAELPPLKILSQLAALQGTYYAASLVLMFFSALVMGNNFSMDLVFGWQAVRGDNTQGWLVGFIWLLVGGLIMYVPTYAFPSLPLFPPLFPSLFPSQTKQTKQNKKVLIYEQTKTGP